MTKEYLQSEYHIAVMDFRLARNEDEQWEARKIMARLEQIAAESYGDAWVNELRNREGLEPY